MTSAHKLWAVFWLSLALALVASQVRRHDGCLAICIYNASTGAN